jgi:hypothetical protein
MARVPATVSPGSVLKVARDFYELRREGIGHIEDTGSGRWTDYNTHDPGITILEAVAYAITELAYRTDFTVADILASASPSAQPDQPYPGQAFYSARTILTVNPTTADDFRRLLIDVDAVRNAWVRCRTCACDAVFFAWCEDGELILSHDPSTRADLDVEPMPVAPRGLYDVLLELEADPDFGDLNDHKVVRRRTWIDADGGLHAVTIEVRFPRWGPDRRDVRRRLADDSSDLQVVASNLTRTKGGATSIDDETLRRRWSDVFYVDLAIQLSDGANIAIDNASVRLFGDGETRKLASVDDLLHELADETPEGFVDAYRGKLAAADRSITTAKVVLESHRNLDEDYCHVDLVEIDEIAACADVEVEPGVDIELVQAKIWFEIEQYLDPPIAFYALSELVAQGEPIEAIFNGPELTNGFLTASGLTETELRPQLRVSDILDRLMDIDGVITVDNLQLTAYDAEGNAIMGAADPTWVDGTPVFDPGRISASWLLFLQPSHRPRLHRRLSRFLFTSNGLPFVPRLDEAEETLIQLQGEAARPKIRAAELDLSWPMGRSRTMESYYPVQYSFPLVYGIGPHGLPTTATALRRAQAKQLKAYLMVFEQLLRNAYAQVARAGELFSLDSGVDHTYFSSLFTESDIKGYSELISGLDAKKLGELVESETEFLERRNRFLDHVMARFGEQFDEYAGLLTDLEGQRAARKDLIDDKIGFLFAVPEVSHDRGKAFDRTTSPCDPENRSGLQRRVNLLLGLPDLAFDYEAHGVPGVPGAGYAHALTVAKRGESMLIFMPPAAVGNALEALLAARGLDAPGREWSIVSGDGQLCLTTVEATGERTEPLLGRAADLQARALGHALVQAKRDILTSSTLGDRYQVASDGNGYSVTVVDAAQNQIGKSARLPTRRAADAFVDRMTTWSAHERAIVVEHLLLRPKFPGDALYPACSDGPCCACGDGDPYSFRMTYVMPGWTRPFDTNLSMRGFADRTIQEQTPSHLLVKICWVGNDGFVPDVCNPVVDALAGVLQEKARTSAGDELTLEEACECGVAIYHAYSEAFSAWYGEKTLEDHQPDALRQTLEAMFDSDVDLSNIQCAAVIDDSVQAELHVLLVDHFVDVTLHGYQFERFEEAWCQWVDADAAFDWTEERLQDTVIAILENGLRDEGVSWDALCTCAATILAEFGTQFRSWIDDNVAAGAPLDKFTAFAPSTVTLCDGLTFKPGVADAITKLLRDRYVGYTEVSYRLGKLLHHLSELRNTYPGATLHDCDEGSDVNPVRLGQTALGSN